MIVVRMDGVRERKNLNDMLDLNSYETDYDVLSSSDFRSGSALRSGE